MQLMNQLLSLQQSIQDLKLMANFNDVSPQSNADPWELNSYVPRHLDAVNERRHSSTSSISSENGEKP